MRVQPQFAQVTHQYADRTVGDHHPFRAGLFDGPQQAGPVGMIGQHEATTHAAPTSCTAQHHPAAGERVAVLAEALHPTAPACRRWRENQCLAQRGVGLLEITCVLGFRDSNAALAVHPVQRFDRAVHQNRADAGVDAVQDALRLAEGVGEQHARLALLGIGAPPFVDPFENLRLRCPSIDRQAKGRFRDESVATHWFKGCARAIGLDLVVAGGNPDFALVFQPHLRRAQHMTGRMQAELHAVMGDLLAVSEGLQIDVLTQTRTQNPLATGGRQVTLVTGTGMVAVRMRDDLPFDRAPGIYIEVTGWTIQTFGARYDKIHGTTVWMGLLAMSRGRAGSSWSFGAR